MTKLLHDNLLGKSLDSKYILDAHEVLVILYYWNYVASQ